MIGGKPKPPFQFIINPVSKLWWGILQFYKCVQSKSWWKTMSNM